MTIFSAKLNRTCPARSSRLPLVFLAAAMLLVLIAGCAAPRPHRAAQAALTRVPPERQLDVLITAFLGDASSRRGLRGADDVAAWLDTHWERLDPTPGTPENELLDLYRRRARWLQERFPDIPFGEWHEPWSIFLEHGLPDARGPVFTTPWLRIEEQSTGRTPPSAASAYLRERLIFGAPERFTLTIREGVLQIAPGLVQPPGPPGLEGIWEVLEDPAASVIDARDALVRLSWYEHPDLARRLLAIPNARFFALADEAERCFRRMASRMAYQLDQQGARRLAALLAAGASGRYALQRASAGAYEAEQLQLDLATLSGRRSRLERSPDRGPHPVLWREPEALLDQLAQRFRDPDRLLGWNWQGDLHLAYGPPVHLDTRTRMAYYIWSTPEVVGIGDTMLGDVQAEVQHVYLEAFLQETARDMAERREQAGAASTTVSRVLSGTEVGTRESRAVLPHLGVLVPPGVYQVGLPREARPPLSMTLDTVAFPAGEDSVEVLVSVGLPTENVFIRRLPDGQMMTDLRVSLILFDHQIRPVYGVSRQQGYLIEGSGEMEGRFLLDIFRFRLPVGSYICYFSAQDPASGQAGGLINHLDLAPMAGGQLQVSPILLATDIQPAEGPGKFVRGRERILPAPSRNFLYGQDLYFHYEVSNLTRSDVGDYAWREVFFIIPDADREGIISLGSTQERSSLTPGGVSSIAIDLQGLQSTYEGPVFLVVLITDTVSGEQRVSATRLTLRRGQR